MGTPATAWTLSDDLRDAARRANVVYTNAPLRSAVAAQYKSATRTQMPLTDGLRMFRDEIVARFPVIRQTYMPGRSRPMVDTQRLDMHQAGRAVDFMVPMLGSAANVSAGDPIANYLVEHAEELGVQLVIWNGAQFCTGQPAARRFIPYTGSSMHRDHLHVEVSVQAGERGLPVYRSNRTVAPAVVPGRDDVPAPYEGLEGPSPLVMAGVGFGGVLALAALGYGAYTLVHRRG